MKLCITDKGIKSCNSVNLEECESCISLSEKIYSVMHLSEDELVEFSGNELDVFFKWQDIANKLSAINNTSKFGKSVRASLVDIEMQMYKLLFLSHINISTLFHNLHFNHLVKKSEEVAN